MKPHTHPSSTQDTRQLISSNCGTIFQQCPSEPDGPSMGFIQPYFKGFSDWVARGRAWGLFSLLMEMPLITRIVSSAYEIIHCYISTGFTHLLTSNRNLNPNINNILTPLKKEDIHITLLVEKGA